MRTAYWLPLFLVLAAASAATLALWPSDAPEEAPPASTVARGAPHEDEAPPPVELKGRRDARPPRETPPQPAEALSAESAEARRVALQATEFKRELRRRLQEIVRLETPQAPNRPERPDLTLGDPHRAPRYRRVDLLGRRVDGTGPWLADGRELAFTGMAQIDHEDAGEAIEEEIEDPLVTAVVGTVLSDGEPVAGAEVILYSTFYQRHARYDHHVREVGRMLTDGYGVFDLRPIGLDTVHFGSNGEVLLTIHREGFGTVVAKRLNNIQPEVENDLGTFELSRASATLVGIVRDLQGEPVEGAAVRVSGVVNPVLYDKTERMIILKDCPTAVTNAAGEYRLESFATGDQRVSLHVNIDCVTHFQGSYPAGEHRWDASVQAGNFIKGRIVDAAGYPVAAAVISSGDNWTPSNADGTFWLDNIVPKSSIDLQVAHHLFACEYMSGVALDTEDLEIVMSGSLPRFELVVTDAASDEPVELITIDWHWAGGRPPHQFVPTSRNWHAASGRFDVVVPEGAVGAHVGASSLEPRTIEPTEIEDGRVTAIALERPE